jgi:anion-transporting  ArsA/GET3 family ATPase
LAPAKLTIVMGKGGVGKTTLSAALALSEASRGKRVGLASLTGADELREAIEVGWGAMPDGLDLLPLEPRAIVDEVVAKLLPLPGMLPLLTSHPAYDAVYRIAPGVKELGVLHKLVVRAEQAGYARLVVDGLATGHGTHFLETPRKSAHLLTGKLAERARELDAILTDPARVEVLLAATLEEMPVRETVELAAKLRAGAFPVRGVLANRALQRLVRSDAQLKALDHLAQRDVASEVASEIGSSWLAVQRHARAAAHMDRRAREMQPHAEALRGLGLPMALVPLEPGEQGRLRRIADHLAEVAS